jgi:hypothetical protein
VAGPAATARMSFTSTEASWRATERDQEKVAAREAWDDGRARRHDLPHDPWSLGKIWALEPGGLPGRLWAGTMLVTCSVRRRSKRELRSSRPDG